jgi:hypothetical protein
MNIIKETSSGCVIKIFPAPIWLLGVILMGIAIFVFLFFHGDTSLNCKRQAAGSGMCLLESTIDKYNAKFAVKELLGAEVVRKLENNIVLYNVQLLTKNKKYLLGADYTTHFPVVMRTVYQINHFVETKNVGFLKVRNAYLAPLMMTIMSLCFIVGIGLLIFARITILLIDKNQNLFLIKKVGLWSKRIAYKLTDIEAAKSEEEMASEQEFFHHYQDLVVTKSGEEIMLGSRIGKWLGSKSIAGYVNKYL